MKLPFLVRATIVFLCNFLNWNFYFLSYFVLFFFTSDLNTLYVLYICGLAKECNLFNEKIFLNWIRNGLSVICSALVIFHCVQDNFRWITSYTKAKFMFIPRKKNNFNSLHCISIGKKKWANNTEEILSWCGMHIFVLHIF